MNALIHDRCSASFRRVFLIARHTLADALHLRLTLLVGLIGGALVVGSGWLREFNFGTAELKFIVDFGFGTMGFFGTVLATLATAHLFLGEICGGAALCVLTRPVRRSEYIWGKLAGVMALLAFFVAGLGLLLVLLLVWRGSQLGGAPLALSALISACALQWLKFSLIAAMTLVISSYAGNALFASCAGLLVAGAAQLRSFAPDGGTITWLRLWPNLGMFDAESVLAAGHTPGSVWLAGVGGYWAIYMIIFGGLAAYFFRHREL